MTYNVKELKELISDLPDDMLVVLSSDEEGNAFDTLGGYSFGHFDEEERELESYEDDEGEIEITQEDATALVLWP